MVNHCCVFINSSIQPTSILLCVHYLPELFQELEIKQQEKTDKVTDFVEHTLMGGDRHLTDNRIKQSKYMSKVISALENNKVV